MSMPLSGFFPGDELPNGATLLDRDEIGADEGVVLALTTREFVTWRCSLMDANTTMWGHYFPTLREAVEDFNERAGR